jgi:hypothetical protein
VTPKNPPVAPVRSRPAAESYTEYSDCWHDPAMPRYKVKQLKVVKTHCLPLPTAKLLTNYSQVVTNYY